MFVTIEGGEGSGKSTITKRLAAALQKQGHQVVTTREPGGSAFAEEVRQLLLHHKQTTPIAAEAELHLFLAARMQHIEEVIRPALNSGAIVLCDRFNDSTIAYQGGGRQLGVERITALCAIATQGLEPDLTLLLDIDPQEGLKRAQQVGSFDRIENEQIAFHQRVRSAYLHLAKLHPNRITIVDASQSVEQVTQGALHGLVQLNRQ